MATPLISVITPCFRQGRYLGAAIDSVQRQTYPHIEMIVVNDGSDDNTDAVATAYGGKINYIRQANMGLSGARNSGIAAAKGDYFLFLDSDDLLDPQAIERMIEAMAGQAPDCLARIGWRSFDSDPNIGEEHLLTDEPLLPRLFKNCGPPHSYLVAAKLVKDAGGFTTRAPGCEDWDLWVRIALGGAGTITAPGVGALYRRYAGSMSRQSLNMDRSGVKVLLGARETIRSDPRLMAKWGHLIASLDADIAGLYFNMGYHSAQSGRLSESIASYRRSIEYGYSAPRAIAGMAKAFPHASRRRIAQLRSK